MNTDYSMWVLEYCHVPKQPADVLWAGRHRSRETVDFPFPVIILQGGGKTILLESGIDWSDSAVVEMANMYGVEDLHQMPDLLQEVGLSAEDIDYVIPTHAAWCGMGGINFYPNATIILQEEDIFGWLRALAKPGSYDGIKGPLHMQHFHNVLDAIEEGRALLLDGPTKNVIPGIDIEVDYEGHSFASQLVVIHNTTASGESDDYMMAADVIFTTDNIFGVGDVPGFIPCTTYNVGSTWKTLQTYQRMYDFANGDPTRLIPAHDYGHWTKYPTKILPKSGMHFAEIRLAEGAASRLL